MRQEIPIASLPRTFQHAVIVASHLGLEYLWIDSLCIIQDSTQDWLQELGLMEDVYTNSICNIAASHSSDGHGGLFRKRNPHLAKALILYPQWGNIKERRHLIIHECGFWKERIDNAPLNKRGWVLQERLLTSRTVHFAHDQIMWENKQERACEVYPDGCNGILQEKDKTKSSLLETWNSNPNHKFDSEISPPYLSWYRILELYTRCLLTRSSDTLPAISGISKRIHLATHDDYLAGLWRRAFPAALLWKSETRWSPRARSPTKPQPGPGHPSTRGQQE